MIDLDLIFKYKKLNTTKLTDYGFVCRDGEYQFSEKIFDGGFMLTVTVSTECVIDYSVTDLMTDEEYVLVKASGVSGAFVAQMREECERVLKDISEKCFDTDSFKSEQTRRIVEFIKESTGTSPDFLWEKTPDCAALRHADTKKWFGVIMTVDKSRVDPTLHGPCEIIDLKAKSETVAKIVDGKNYYPGYHMNKKYWYTIFLDGTLDDETIQQRITDSYNIT